jgi:hypothetical protein
LESAPNCKCFARIEKQSAIADRELAITPFLAEVVPRFSSEGLKS